jgi:hypothetical protein
MGSLIWRMIEVRHAMVDQVVEKFALILVPKYHGMVLNKLCVYDHAVIQLKTTHSSKPTKLLSIS